MNKNQKAFARRKATEAAGVLPADQARVEAAYAASYSEAKGVGLADDKEALRAALVAVAAPKVEDGLKVYDALEKRAEAKRPARGGRRMAVATLVLAAGLLLIFVLFRATLAGTDRGAAPTVGPTPTTAVVITSPKDADVTEVPVKP